MRSNLFSDRIQIQTRVVTESAMGQTLTWTPVQWIHGRVIPLDATARASYQQIGSVVTHKIISDTGVTLNLADYRFKHLDKTYSPAQPPVTLADNKTIAVVEI